MPFDLLDRHLVVVGQSGSGKSYFIGKMVEELALKTGARVAILDRAGDFLKLRLSVDKQVIKEMQYVDVHSQWMDRWIQDHGQVFYKLSVHPSWFDAVDLCAAFGLPADPAFLGDAKKDRGRDDLGFQPIINQLNAVDMLTDGLFSRDPEPVAGPEAPSWVEAVAELEWQQWDTPRRVAQNHDTRLRPSYDDLRSSCAITSNWNSRPPRRSSPTGGPLPHGSSATKS
jgi:ABC-type oligopeptide transport system ATPase subunit